MARVYRDPRLRKPTGQVVWCIDYRDARGQRHRRRTPAVTKQLAQRILRRKLEDVEEAKLRGLALKESIPLSEFSQEYLVHIGSLRSKNARNRMESTLKGLVQAFGHRNLGEITTADLQRWLDERLATPLRDGRSLQPGTAVLEVRCLSGLMKEAVKRGYLGGNPCRGVTMPKVTNARTRFLSEEEEARLLSVCTPELKPMILTALRTGLRKGELFSMRWEDIDAKNALLTVPRGKGGKRRYIPLVPEIIALLERTPRREGEANPFVFPSPRTGRAWVDINRPWRRILEVAGIKNFRFHDLRHTFASRLAQRGAPLKAIQELLGHSDLKMTMRYAHLGPGDLRNAVLRLVAGGSPMAA